jgi:hypothetical protein
MRSPVTVPGGKYFFRSVPEKNCEPSSSRRWPAIHCTEEPQHGRVELLRLGDMCAMTAIRDQQTLRVRDPPDEFIGDLQEKRELMITGDDASHPDLPR